MKTLLFLACTCLVMTAAPCFAGEKEKAPEELRPAIVEAILSIARGTTMYERTAPNVSLYLGPTRTFIAISF